MQHTSTVVFFSNRSITLMFYHFGSYQEAECCPSPGCEQMPNRWWYTGGGRVWKQNKKANHLLCPKRALSHTDLSGGNHFNRPNKQKTKRETCFRGADLFCVCTAMHQRLQEAAWWGRPTKGWAVETSTAEAETEKKGLLKHDSTGMFFWELCLCTFFRAV